MILFTPAPVSLVLADDESGRAQRFFLTPDGPMREQVFDHLSTGFALTGHHKELACDDCHVSGFFEKLPTRCNACHDNIIAPGEPAGHVITILPCDICHTTLGFVEHLVMDHGVNTAPCVTCHDGLVGRGKGSLHIQTTSNCERCHGTAAWSPVLRVDHNEVFSNCIQCHDNNTAKGQGVSHIKTSARCETCHLINANSWKMIVRVDHDQVMGACVQCHDNVVAKGKSVNHLLSGELCEACHHVGFRWKDVFRVDHSQVSGVCDICHRKPPQHIRTVLRCEVCHVAEQGWKV